MLQEEGLRYQVFPVGQVPVLNAIPNPLQQYSVISLNGCGLTPGTVALVRFAGPFSADEQTATANRAGCVTGLLRAAGPGMYTAEMYMAGLSGGWNLAASLTVQVV